ncbi:hypothetical protein WDU94_000147 [Cyamophila willieti]
MTSPVDMSDKPTSKSEDPKSESKKKTLVKQELADEPSDSSRNINSLLEVELREGSNDDRDKFCRTTTESYMEPVGPRFPCSQCEKTFSKNSNLQKHIRHIHDGKKYPCSLCDKVFAAKDRFIQHLDNHDGVKYTCVHCSKTFLHKSSMKQHEPRCSAQNKKKGNKKK